MAARRKSPEINPENPPPGFSELRDDYRVSRKVSRPEVQTDLIQRAKRILGVRTGSEAIRLALENLDTLTMFDYHLRNLEETVELNTAAINLKLDKLLDVSGGS